MKFTNEVPTKDGYYLWRFDLSFIPYVVCIENGYTEAGNLPPEMSSEWCRLVPEDEVSKKDELEKAYKEGWLACDEMEEHETENRWKGMNEQFEGSRAKRVMEGML